MTQPSTPIRIRALAHLRDGRIKVTQATTSRGGKRPTKVVAHCTGWTTHQIRYSDGVWSCTCPELDKPCSHIAAVQLVTGHPSAASSRTAPK